MTHLISGRSIRTGSSIWCSWYPTRVHITESVFEISTSMKYILDGYDDSFYVTHITWVKLTLRIRWVLEAFESHLRGNLLIGCWLNDLYFRWLNIKAIDTEFTISISLFFNHLNSKAGFTQTWVNWCFFHFSFIVTAFTSGHFGFISGRSTEQKFRKLFFEIFFISHHLLRLSFRFFSFFFVIFWLISAIFRSISDWSCLKIRFRSSPDKFWDRFWLG